MYRKQQTDVNRANGMVKDVESSMDQVWIHKLFLYPWASGIVSGNLKFIQSQVELSSEEFVEKGETLLIR